MDIMGYKEIWSDDGNIPDHRINVKSHYWNMASGEHYFADCKHKNTICRKIKRIEEVSSEIANSDFAVKPIGDIEGHMMVTDATNSEVIGANLNTPIMPNYVRDLAGRIICIAESFPVQKEPSRTKRFPEGSFVVDENIDADNLIERVFFANFRTLDMSIKEKEYYKGYDVVKYSSYDSANLHPYKLRVDSFYQDGWKLPQTEMLFVKKQEDQELLQSKIDEFDKKWEEYLDKHNYEAFYESVGGEEYFEELFNAGITLIPTLEAYNANPIVDEHFNLVDFHSGKFVSEFHDVHSYVDSDLPSGTIVNVVEPGYITHYRIKKATVVVSNGSSYVSKHNDPDPLFPDLRLPHQRTSSKWGDVFIPTHPKHFEISAIWGWDAKTGLFMQEKGPIWDPLHYYYESVDKIIKAYDGEVLDENYWLIPVPSEMKMKFYPVVPFEGFDVLDMSERNDRIEHRVRPTTMCKRYTENVFSANIGYHSMPPEFEYELDSWFSPELSPVKRVISDVPLNIRSKIADPILCNVPAKLYLSRQSEVSQGNPYWVNDMTHLHDSTGEFKNDYPYLARYYENLISKVRVSAMSNLYVFVDDVDLSMLRAEYVSSLKIPNNIDESIRDFTLAYYDLKEKSFLRIKNRVDLFDKFYDEYLMSSWNSSACDDMSYMLKDQNIEKLNESQFSSVAIMQPPTF
jgi:hypothetical protein